MKKNIKVNTEWMSQLETLTKDGKASKVNELIKGLNFKKVPREFRYLISQICFRNSLYIESLKVLNPIIHPSTPNSPKPKAQELISYANALVSINMNTEARKLLKKVNKEEYPEALLIESFSYFGEWNYEKTIPILRKFIANPKLSYYRQIVGKVNLAAALVTTLKISEAEQLLFELLKITQENKYNLLQGNTLELLAQLEIQKRNYHQSLKYLKQLGLENLKKVI